MANDEIADVAATDERDEFGYPVGLKREAKVQDPVDPPKVDPQKVELGPIPYHGYIGDGPFPTKKDEVAPIVAQEDGGEGG